MSGNGRGYQGGIGVTVSGLPCQQWSVQAPQKHIITPSTYVDDLKDSSVYCRNPGGLGERPWCYTTDLRTRWEYCNIPQCGKMMLSGVVSILTPPSFPPSQKHVISTVAAFVQVLDSTLYM